MEECQNASNRHPYLSPGIVNTWKHASKISAQDQKTTVDQVSVSKNWFEHGVTRKEPKCTIFLDNCLPLDDRRPQLSRRAEARTLFSIRLRIPANIRIFLQRRSRDRLPQ